jgi:hypothetical protein
MPDGSNNKKKVQIKPFNYKLYEFLISYTIINLFIFSNITANISSIYENISKLFVKDFIIDGTNLSIFANLFAGPIILFLALMSIVIILSEEFIMTLLFKFIYFTTMVLNEEKSRLLKNIKTAILCFIPANIAGVILWGGMKKTMIFIFFYLPLPLFTFILIYLKMKKLKTDNIESIG